MPPEPLRCAGAPVFNDDCRLHFQRRSPHRKLFPDTGDLVGGHLEPGEDTFAALLLIGR